MVNFWEKPESGKGITNKMPRYVNPEQPQSNVNVTVNAQSSAPKLIQMNCPNCGAGLTVNSKFETATCNACGSTFPVDSGTTKIETRIVDEAEIKRQEAEKEIALKNIELKEKEKEHDHKIGKMIIVGYGIFMLFLFVSMGISRCQDTIQDKRSEKAGMIKAPNSDTLKNENYKYVESTLKASGFTSIELIDIDENDNSGKVKTVSINGDSDFYNDWFYPDAKVVISYH